MLLGIAGSATAAEPTSSGAAILRARVERAIADREVPGVVIAVLSGDAIVFQEAWGHADLESGRTQRTDDLFYLASTSKPLAMTAIMTLVESGDLALDDEASEWFPAWKAARTAAGETVRSPTVAELMSHQSGMFGTSSPELHRLLPSASGTRQLAEAVNEMIAVPLVHRPGEAFDYGGGSMCVAARIAEIRAQAEFDQITERRVFAPLGMTETFYRTPRRELEARTATLYRKGPDGFVRAEANYFAKPGDPVRPPGSIFSTARDLASFLRLHLREGEVDGKRILQTDTVRAMRRSLTGTKEVVFAGSRSGGNSAGIGSAQGYGLGWILDEIGEDGLANVFSHGGAWGTFIWGDARAGLGAVLLTHVPLPEAAKLWNDVVPIIRDTWGERQPDRPSSGR
jgi:CubicO group peptidase (beta-lactamase class C family)